MKSDLLKVKLSKQIKLNMSRTAINAVCWILEELDTEKFYTSSKEEKSAYSLAFVLSKKMRKKLIDREGNLKDFTMKLVYHEAYALYLILLAQKHVIDYDCISELTEIQLVINQLDQKLL